MMRSKLTYCHLVSLIIICLVTYSCSTNAQSKKSGNGIFSTSLKNGSIMTSSASNADGSQFILAGETIDQEKDDKNGMLVFLNKKGDVTKAITLGNATTTERIERIISDNGSKNFATLLTTGSNKLATIISFDADGKTNWSKTSKNARSNDGCDIAFSDSTFAILSRKLDEKGDPPPFEPFTVSCFNKKGDFLWAQSFNFIEWGIGIEPFPGGGYVSSGKAKGYYIDSEDNNGKLFRITMGRFSEKGDLVWGNVLMFKKDLYDEFYINKLLTDKDGNIFLMGFIKATNTKKKNPFIVKLNQDGNPMWAKQFPMDQDAQFKTAGLDTKGNFIGWTDGYGMSKGFGAINIDIATGDVKSAKLFTSSMFDQIRDYFSIGKNSYLGWDHTLSYSLTAFNDNGESCLESQTVTNIVAQPVEIVVTKDNNNAYTSELEVKWEEAKIDITPKNITKDIIINNCAQK